MENVRPLEHGLGFGSQLGVGDLDGGFLERHPRRLHQYRLGEIVVLVHFQRGCGGVRLSPERFIENRVAVIEGVEQPVRRLVTIPERPVVRRLQVELLMRR